ncbi:hypothetical protein C8R44DRAFT_975139 [Mycena epipterygia]|nr:hypothetical protein C8R44DRAFT_975139 [Mycena epipterygia]
MPLDHDALVSGFIPSSFLLVTISVCLGKCPSSTSSLIERLTPKDTSLLRTKHVPILPGLAPHDRRPSSFTAPPHVQHLLQTDPITLLTTDVLSAAFHRAFFADLLARPRPTHGRHRRSSPHRGTGGGYLLYPWLVDYALRFF